jgi:hypothetical protein
MSERDADTARTRVREFVRAACEPAAGQTLALRDSSLVVRFALRLFERAPGAGEFVHAEALATPSTLPALVVHPAGDWFEAPGQPRVECRPRPALRGVLRALVQGRLERPGQSLAPDVLVRAGWPGERIVPQAAKNRLHATIKTLRQLGLRQVLVSRSDGYLLDPNVPLLRPES